jgi:hypothetical protein
MTVIEPSIQDRRSKHRPGFRPLICWPKGISVDHARSESIKPDGYEYVPILLRCTLVG